MTCEKWNPAFGMCCHSPSKKSSAECCKGMESYLGSSFASACGFKAVKVEEQT